MRSRLDEEMARLHRELIRMGGACEEAIALAAKALAGERELAERISPLEREIDQMERDIESLCLKLLLRQQPVAHDLRQVSAALKMITDLERIGDQAEDIAEIILTLDGGEVLGRKEIQEMAQAVIGMVTGSVDAYVRQDVDLARQVIAADDTVDRAFLQVREVLIRAIAADPSEGGRCLDILMIDKYFERIGDHAANIAEWVIFSITGVHKEALA